MDGFEEAVFGIAKLAHILVHNKDGRVDKVGFATGKSIGVYQSCKCICS